jgi:lipopolysaccharide transport system ATP-binding protein
MEEVAALCDEVLVLEEGRVAIQADPETAINHYHDLMRQRTERKRQDLIASQKITPAISANQNRSGTGEATIEAVSLYTLQGEPLDIVMDGKGVIIELSYLAQELLPDMAVTLGIYSHANVQCFETSIPSVKSFLGSFPSQGSLYCRLEALPLLPGRYYINVGLFPLDWNYIYDYHWQMHPIDIKSRKNMSSEVSGIVSVDLSWSINCDESNLKFHHRASS